MHCPEKCAGKEPAPRWAAREGPAHTPRPREEDTHRRRAPSTKQGDARMGKPREPSVLQPQTDNETGKYPQAGRRPQGREEEESQMVKDRKHSEQHFS